jgi:aquaporin Z
MLNNTKLIFSELLGTFILVFTWTGAVVFNEISGGAVTALGIGLVFGLVVMVLVYTLGDISGAHINPAVTLDF